MRLTEEQKHIILDQTVDIIGPDAHVWLFGSRTDDQRKGGDIDLLIEVNRVLKDRVLLAARLAARLERRFHGLPVDVVLKDQATTNQPIHQIARQMGVRL